METTSPTATEAAAEAVARACSGPLVVGLRGALGAGKTCFARGFVRGMDDRFAAWVSSPTYAICNTYPTEPLVHHVDLYRVEGVDDLESVGFWDLLGSAHVLVEWPDRVPDVGEEIDLDVELVRRGGESRVLRLCARTVVGQAVLDEVSKSRAT